MSDLLKLSLGICTAIAFLFDAWLAVTSTDAILFIIAIICMIVSYAGILKESMAFYITGYLAPAGFLVFSMATHSYSMATNAYAAFLSAYFPPIASLIATMLTLLLTRGFAIGKSLLVQR